MPLFRRRRQETVIGPDGTAYTPVDAAVADETAVMLADRVVPQMHRQAPDWVGLTLTGTFSYIICSLRGSLPDEDSEEVTRLVLTAAKAGYEARIEEFAAGGWRGRDSRSCSLVRPGRLMIDTPTMGSTFPAARGDVHPT